MIKWGSVNGFVNISQCVILSVAVKHFYKTMNIVTAQGTMCTGF